MNDNHKIKEFFDRTEKNPKDITVVCTYSDPKNYEAETLWESDVLNMDDINTHSFNNTRLKDINNPKKFFSRHDIFECRCGFYLELLESSKTPGGSWVSITVTDESFEKDNYPCPLSKEEHDVADIIE